MSDARIRVRANPSTGELEVEGPSQAVAEWWERLWPELSQETQRKVLSPDSDQRQAPLPPNGTGQLPEIFGEFYSEFRSDVSDQDKVLIAAAFVQDKEQDRSFTTKAANQLLLDQNIKIANASEYVRRLMQTKRVFVVSGGNFRLSASGLEYLKSLEVNA
jgi:hypothetical protein